MTKIFISMCFFSLVFISGTVTSASQNNKDDLIRRCDLLFEQVNVLESYQYKMICKTRLATAAEKINMTKWNITYEHYEEAHSYLATIIKDLKFAEDISCASKYSIRNARVEAMAIKEHLG